MKKIINPHHKVICPSCGVIIDRQLILGFHYCVTCEIAVRNEVDMPEYLQIYNSKWVARQEKSKTHSLRALNALHLIKKNLPEVRSALDIGCGTGILVDLFNKHGVETDGADSSSEAIGFAKTNKQGQFYLIDGNQWNPSSGKPYNLIIAMQLIEHLRNPGSFLEGVKESMSKGGYLYIETPNIRCYSPFSCWRNRFGGMTGTPDHRIIYSPTSLSSLLEDHGFEISMLKTWTYSPSILDSFYNNILSWINRRFRRQSVEINSNISNETSQPDSKKSADLLKKLWLKRKMKMALERLFNSTFLAVLLYLPNRISEWRQRGVQVIIIASLRRET